MHPIVFRLACLALFACVLALMAQESEAVDGKVHVCCKTVSTQKINSPISGYRYQKKDLPCVNAVIFTTAEGEHCVYSKLPWVRAKIKELRTADKNSL